MSIESGIRGYIEEFDRTYPPERNNDRRRCVQAITGTYLLEKWESLRDSHERILEEHPKMDIPPADEMFRRWLEAEVVMHWHDGDRWHRDEAQEARCSVLRIVTKEVGRC